MTRLPRAVTVARLLTILICAVLVMPGVAMAQEDALADLTQPLELTGKPLNVETIPAIEGVEIAVGDLVATTGADGVARFSDSPPRASLNNQILRILNPSIPLGNNRRADFSRLYYLNATRDVVATFDIYHRVGLGFRDVDDRPVESSRVSSVLLRSSLGGELTVETDEPLWLQSGRVARSTGELELKDVEWAVVDVTVDASSVVNRGQQRFTPSYQGRTFEIELLFFQAQFTSRDGFFGFPIGEGILLEHPDGRVDAHRFPEDGPLVLEALPRGEYRVAVVGPGPTMFRPLALSRNQSVDLKLFTWFDISAVIALIGAFMFGLIAVGRARELKRRTGAPGIMPVPADVAVPEPAQTITLPEPARTITLPEPVAEPQSEPVRTTAASADAPDVASRGARITTLPRISGLRVLVDGTLVTTGSDGLATLDPNLPIDLDGVVEVLDPICYPSADTRAMLLDVDRLVDGDVRLSMALETFVTVPDPDAGQAAHGPDVISGIVEMGVPGHDLVVKTDWSIAVRWSSSADGQTWKLHAALSEDTALKATAWTLRIKHPTGRIVTVSCDDAGTFDAIAIARGRYQVSLVPTNQAALIDVQGAGQRALELPDVLTIDA